MPSHRRSLKRFRSDPLVGNLLALTALFVALGATSAYAINEWTGENIVDESLTGRDILGRNGTGQTAGINGAVTSADVSGQPAIPGAGQPFVDGSLTTHDLADGGILGKDIKDSSIGSVDVTGLGSSDVSGLTGADLDESTLRGPLLRNRHLVQGHGPTSSESQRTVRVGCPLGEVATGGGGVIVGSAKGLAIRASAPYFAYGFSGWNITAAELNPTGSNWSVVVTVVCVEAS